MKIYNKNNIKHSIFDFIEQRKSLSDTDKIEKSGYLIYDIKSVNVDSAFNKVYSRINKSNTNSTKIITWITRIAAIFALPLLVYNILNYSSDKRENSITMQEISCPIGMKSHIILPDGTDVWLNSGSKINYELPFVRETRKLTLSGEAFLHVKKNESSPFLVNSGEERIEVLGTQFNVKAYPEDNQIEVALKEGSVKFCFTNSSGKKIFTRLKPNNYLVLNRSDKKLSIENKELDNYMLWTKNILIFNNTPMLEVAKTLERWYGVTVIIKDDEIKNYKFTTIFENETISRILELLELTSPISIKYTRGKINRTTNKLNKSIVTISKKITPMK